MNLKQLSLDDKYALEKTTTYMTGIEALVRLPILQHQRDIAAGLNTAGFISGYRGSPVGGVDQAAWRAKSYLDKHNIHFQAGLNEDLAATSVWGTQQLLDPATAKYDGVFSLWYAKGPGVDRSMDVIKHANYYGTTQYGGVLAVAGDDHASKSSTLPHQSDHMFVGASVPLLSPANVQEVLDMGIIGWALSRYAGVWVGLKAITENMDSAMSVVVDPQRVSLVIPDNFEMPEQGINAQNHPAVLNNPLEQEYILNKYRIYAAIHFAKVNKLNRIELNSDHAKLGIITAGKSYLDVMQAMEDLGIDEQTAAKIGIRILKLGMTWPLEPTITHEFAKGLDEIIVVEEKRSIIQDQLNGQLYNSPVKGRPRVVGEFDEQGNDLLTNQGELTPAMVARVIAKRIAKFYHSDEVEQRVAFINDKERRLAEPREKLDRLPHFCSGCPHNTSTKVPENSKAAGGIGCHIMATWMDRDNAGFTHMGGEGAQWIGQAPFSNTKHIFQNLGDGTYFHSGLLAIRAAIAAKVNITYKILYNNVVAMTGGQPHDGEVTVDKIIKQVHAEGVERIAIVSDEPEKYKYDKALPSFTGLTIHHRSELQTVQEQLREVSGASVLVYDQHCAAEKRRLRKKKQIIDPPVRVFINQDVCEGCGDCSVKSNCLSVLPKETELGRKREIDQSACNKDVSCVNGFCPSFVTIEGGQLRKKTGLLDNVDFVQLPDPVLPSLEKPWNVMVTGIGGTGVLTISSLLAMAAHLEGKGCATLNQTGLAQKFGAVSSHVRIGKAQKDIYTVRIAAGDADLILGCDLVTSCSDDALAKMQIKRTHAVINDSQTVTAEFIKNPDLQFPAQAMKQSISEEVGDDKVNFIDASHIATSLLGDSIASNLFLLGYAYQKGLIPVSQQAIEQAIDLNNVAIEFNKKAFEWGRRCAHDLATVLSAAQIAATNESQSLSDLDDKIAWRVQFLTDYQDKEYAQTYLQMVEQVRLQEGKLNNSDCALTSAVAMNLFKLMAYKDEYEVARLYTNGDFEKRINEQFEGDFKINFHLAPPIFSRKDKLTGHLIKRRFPQMTMSVFKILARLKGLRGTKLDIFSYTQERKQERRLIVEYRQTIEHLLSLLDDNKYSLAVTIAQLPQKIRGYGHVKEANIANIELEKARLMQRYNGQNITEITIEGLLK